MGSLPTAGTWAELEVPASMVGLGGKSVSGIGLFLYNGAAAWDEIGTGSTVWIDGAPPSSYIYRSASNVWAPASSDPAPVSGAVDFPRSYSSALQQDYFYDFDSDTALPVAAGDSLYVYVYLDPTHPPSEVRLGWLDSTGTWHDDAYWGPSGDWGVDVGPSQRPVSGSAWKCPLRQWASTGPPLWASPSSSTTAP